MFSYNIDSFESAGKLVRLCEKYHDKMEIDVLCGRYIIDGCSTLGVHSLVGHTVSLELGTDDNDVIKRFGEDLEKIK